MNAIRPRINGTTWIGAMHSVDEVPNFTLYLAQERIGQARLALAHLDTNHVRTLYLGRLETSLGELAVLVEVPVMMVPVTREAREAVTALKVLDATSYSFDHGRVEAHLDPVFGLWTVEVDGETLAEGMDRETAVAVAHKQVAS